jgi:hypothetical protein
MIKRFSIAFVCIAGLAVSFAMVQNWNIGGGNKISFKIKSALGMVDGTVDGLKGTLSSTIVTGISKRDKDIKYETSWFDIKQYPVIGFKSESISKSGSGYVANGTLTIKGTAKKVQIPFTFTDGAAGSTFVGSLKLNRLDYKVGPSTVMVKDTVDVVITVPAKK